MSNKVEVALPSGNFEVFEDVSTNTKVLEGTLLVYTGNKAVFFAQGSWTRAEYTESDES